MGEYFGAPRHLQHPASAAQARCDAIQADYRAERDARPVLRREPPPRKSIRREPPPLAPAPVVTDDVLSLRLADELDYARRMLEAMGDALSADTAVVMRHMTALQSVDIIGQMLGHIAAVVRSGERDGAVERIGMGDLKARLQRRGGL